MYSSEDRFRVIELYFKSLSQQIFIPGNDFSERLKSELSLNLFSTT